MSRALPAGILLALPSDVSLKGYGYLFDMVFDDIELQEALLPFHLGLLSQKISRELSYSAHKKKKSHCWNAQGMSCK